MCIRDRTKRGEMLVCPDRECGYRRSVKQTTNARCPNCHKRMELRGEGEKQLFACVCGYREKMCIRDRGDPVRRGADGLKLAVVPPHREGVQQGAVGQMCIRDRDVVQLRPGLAALHVVEVVEALIPLGVGGGLRLSLIHI